MCVCVCVCVYNSSTERQSRSIRKARMLKFPCKQVRCDGVRNENKMFSWTK